MTNLAIEVLGLRKSFGDHVVLDGVDLAVAEGSVFALIGPNGSGKTTTVWVLSTILPCDGGTVRVGGHDARREAGLVRRAIGVTGQFSAVDNVLTGEENLLLMADLGRLSRSDGRRRAIELLERFDLAGAGGKPAVTYSGGMRRRLDLAMTLIGEPSIIFLDEPTTGLDPRSRRTMWEIVRELSASGVTIFLTTQYLEEADHLADRIAVLDDGRLVGEGTPAELKRVIPGGHVELRLPDAAALDAAARLVDAENTTHDRDALVVRVPTGGSVGALRTLLDRLDDHRVAVESVSVHTADLDDVFFALTGRSDPAEHAVGEGAR
ncbi:MAG: ATP-binding cassette domain-containing protein [Streptosporangiaceae bacterium]